MRFTPVELTNPAGTGAAKRGLLSIISIGLQGGTRFISQRVKAVKVKLKAGYKVLLVTKKQ